MNKKLMQILKRCWMKKNQYVLTQTSLHSFVIPKTYRNHRSQKVDLSLATINRLEKGHVEPKAKDLVRFAKEFGVSLDWSPTLRYVILCPCKKIREQKVR